MTSSWIFASTLIIHLSDVTVSDRYLINVDRGLYYQGYSFALAKPGGTPSVKVVDVGSLGPRARVSPLCFADHAVKQSVMDAAWPLQQVPHQGHSDTKQC